MIHKPDMWILFGFFLLVGDMWLVRSEDKHLIRVRRGNYGTRNSGGLGGFSHGSSYSQYQPPSPVVFDYIAQHAKSGGVQDILNSHQAQMKAQASSAQGLHHLQQQGQHAAAAAGARANQASAWYNTIATGRVPSGYKGENGRK